MNAKLLIIPLIMAIAIWGTACKKCQTCVIDYSYEYDDTDSQGDPITVTESAQESSSEECSSSSNLDDMETQWNQDAQDLKTQLEGQGSKNVQTTVTCTRS